MIQFGPLSDELTRNGYICRSLGFPSAALCKSTHRPLAIVRAAYTKKRRLPELKLVGFSSVQTVLKSENRGGWFCSAWCCYLDDETCYLISVTIFFMRFLVKVIPNARSVQRNVSCCSFGFICLCDSLNSFEMSA